MSDTAQRVGHSRTCLVLANQAYINSDYKSKTERNNGIAVTKYLVEREVVRLCWQLIFKKEVVCRYGAYLRKDDAIFLIKHCRVTKSTLAMKAE